VTPQSNSVKRITSRDLGICNNLNQCFSWFDSQFTESLTTSSDQFLYYSLYFFLYAVTEEPQTLWKGNEYFVTQLDIADKCPFCIKLSDTAVKLILDKTFGEREGRKESFKIRDITELEGQILTAYNNFLFKNLRDTAFNEKFEIEQIQPLPGTRTNLIYLTLYLYHENLEENEAGKVIIYFPEYALKEPEMLTYRQELIDIFQYEESCTRADIFVGKSKISLEDLKMLEIGDIVVLEKSNLHFMTIKGDEDITFSVNPDPRLVMNINDPTGGKFTMNETDTSAKNIWDNLQVEVSAEFKSIKMSLGELRQITEGLVIDIAPIVQNDILLHVDGARIASGELVIIGDKYGIKITKVFPEPGNKEKLPPPQPANLKPEEKNLAMQEYDEEEFDDSEENQEDEDFDYSDFEIEEDM